MQLVTIQNEIDKVSNNFNTLSTKIDEINNEIKNHYEEINKLTTAKTNIENEQRFLQGEYKQLTQIYVQLEKEQSEALATPKVATEPTTTSDEVETNPIGNSVTCENTSN